MISTASIVKSIVEEKPFLEEALARDVISYSALARDIKPAIEKKLMKKVKLGAIVMALKRLSTLERSRKQISSKLLNLQDITVRSNLVELTYLHSDMLVEKEGKLFSTLEQTRGVVYTISQGIRETTLIVNKSLAYEVVKELADERLVSRFDGLASVTLRLTKETVDTPGVYYELLKLLAWENINIVEVISTYTELTILFQSEDADRAIKLLRSIT